MAKKRGYPNGKVKKPQTPAQERIGGEELPAGAIKIIKKKKPSK
jgi:hypothetical protein